MGHRVVKTAFGTGEIMVILVATERKIPEVELLIDLILHSLENPAAVKDPKGRDFRDGFPDVILNFLHIVPPVIGIRSCIVSHVSSSPHD
jgi:hypothetical protein